VERVLKKLKQTAPGLGDRPDQTEEVAFLAEREPAVFLRRLFAALERERPAVCMNPDWPQTWAQSVRESVRRTAPSPGEMLLATSGSTAIPKLCRHTITTLHSAASGFADRFGASGIVHAVNVLPCHHIGGLMPVFRAAACSGMVHFADYRDTDSLLVAPFPLRQASISLVPTQLHRMLEDAECVQALRRFGLILIGGAAAGPPLLDRARQAGLRISLCYGSTETAAMVTALDPEAFLNGARSVGTALPHAEVSIDENRGILVISESITHGYLNQSPPCSRQPFATGDLGRFDESRHLHILGRADRAFTTGGETVHPEQVEAAALATGLLASATCRGVPDRDWGMRVELNVHFLTSCSSGPAALADLLSEALPPYARPKRIIDLDRQTD